jgi:hypothetical protein
MVKLTDLKPGDIVRVMDDGTEREGVVIDIDRNDHLVCIDYGVQEFWFPVEQVLSIPLNEDEMLKLGFIREETEDGIKYLKGPFRVLTPQAGNFTNFEIWYREDRRHFTTPMMVHELQNHYLEMTKVPLEKPVIH